jgi:hypothetical protein
MDIDIYDEVNPLYCTLDNRTATKLIYVYIIVSVAFIINYYFVVYVIRR